jgi:nucleotide-binding universal stress UspA family protein
MKLLAASDGSESATRAVETAARLSKALGAKLVIMTVGAPRLSLQERVEARRLGMSEGDTLDALSQQILDQARKHARTAGAADVQLVYAVGDPAQSILEVAQREPPDMLVVGRRGHGRLAGLLLGSVSQKLVGLAPCSVVVVP